MRGRTLELKFEEKHNCPKCEGWGNFMYVDQDYRMTCHYCHGTGVNPCSLEEVVIENVDKGRGMLFLSSKKHSLYDKPERSIFLEEKNISKKIKNMLSWHWMYPIIFCNLENASHADKVRLWNVIPRNRRFVWVIVDKERKSCVFPWIENNVENAKIKLC